jgi:2-isopropylmalate synthase
VEGTLFGNGERTGNVDIITLALNLYTQGIDPKLNIRDINRVRDVSERCTEIATHPRHPYAGDLVFAAFSGSHQDAIRKGFRDRDEHPKEQWEVPYLPLDPTDIGRDYEPIIRINSQSGKGGVAFVMHAEFGCDLPREMHPEFSRVIQDVSERLGKEVQAGLIWEAFQNEYLDRSSPFQFVDFHLEDHPNGRPGEVRCFLKLEVAGQRHEVQGIGNGPLDSCRNALLNLGAPTFSIRNYWEHARTSGSDAEAVAYVRIELETGETVFGAGIDPNITLAPMKALLSALNRAVAAHASKELTTASTVVPSGSV